MRLLIVNFHYIRDIKYNNGIYPRSLKELSLQIDELSKYYTFISKEELEYKIINKKYDQNNYCLITFDDGLKEQMDAFEFLWSKGIPAIFYVTTSSIRNNTVVDVHKLHYIRSKMDDNIIYNYICKNIDDSIISYPKNLNDLYRYDKTETKKLKYLLNFILSPTIKDKLISTLLNQLIDEQVLSKELYMNKNDILKLSKFNSIGTHCDLHLPLATLTKEEIKKDINDSIDFLENECNCDKITTISYPYGGPKAVSSKVIETVKEFNFTFGLTMFRGINTEKDFQEPLLLKRIDTNDAPGGKLDSKEYVI